MKNMNTWLITGGAGFIGANFIGYIFEKYPNDFIICFDNLTYAGDINNFSKYMHSERFRFIKGDICDFDDLNIIFNRFDIDYVVNFAAETHVDRSIEYSIPFMKSNVEGVAALLEVCRHHNIKRFHQVSTDEVYGPTEMSLDENAKLNPTSSYAVSKASADLLCLSFHKTFKTPITISRSTNNYGIMQHCEKFIPNMISKIARGEKPTIYGTGLNKRDWIHVLDHCSAIDLIIKQGNNGEIYNISSGTSYTNLEVAEAVYKALGFEKNDVEFVEDRLAHDRCYNISNKKIMQELGWVPKYSFKKDLEAIAKWYQK